MIKLVESMAKNPVAANLLMLILIVGGLFSIRSTKQEVFPEFELDLISIVVPYKGATPAEIEESIVLPVEEAIEGTVGIKTITSTAYEGAGRIALELEEGEDNARILDDVKSAVDGISTFPDNTETPIVNLLRRKREVLTIVVFGEVAEQSLREIAENVKNEFLSKENVTQVELAGVRDYEIAIEISQEQLRRYRLTLPQVSNLIQESTLDLPSGTLKTSGGDVLIRTKERRYTAAEYAQIPILSTDEGKVLLQDIATIEDRFEEVNSYSTFNGKRAVLLEVYRVGQQTPREVAKTVRQSIEEIRARLPASVEIDVMQDRSIVLDERIDLLLRNAKLGLILVMILLTMFLELKLAFWIMMGIPISFLGALLMMPALDVSINMISLFAFILVLGLVVDDAIVVGENIYSHQQMGKSKIDASIQGAIEIGGPVVFAILTTVVAFSPFFFIVGIMGKFMQAIPLIVIAVLLISLLECMYILPAHLAHSKKGSSHQEGILGWFEKIRNYPSIGLKKFTHGPYQKILAKALEFRYTTLAIGIFLLLIGGGATVGGYLKFTFLPRIDSDQVFASVTMPFGTPISTTRQANEKVVAAAQELIAEYEQLHENSATRGIFSIVGGLGGRGNRGSHLTSVRVYLHSLDMRGFSAREFSNKWRQKVGAIPGVESITFRFSLGPGAGSDLNVRFIHPDDETLEKAVTRLSNHLSEYSGVSDIEDSHAEGKPEIQLQLKPEGNLLGMTTFGLTQQVRAAFQGLEVLQIQRDSNQVKVMLRYPLEERQYLQNLEDLIVQTPSGGEVPLSRVAFLKHGHSYSEINRENGKRVVDVTAKVDSQLANTVEIMASLRNGILPELRRDYPQLETAFAGRNQSRQESLQSLAKGGWYALFMIYFLLALQFRSYFQPFVVMIAIPFGVIGALAGHWFMSYDLSLISLMGVLALSGIVVNDSLILVDFINKARSEGAPLKNAIIQAGMRRFRPILLTSLTTFFGLLPMIFETSVQARFLIPMAISLGFGVMLATFITLLLIPAMYLILEDLLMPFRKLFLNPVEPES